MAGTLILPQLTACKVHKIIQVMDITLPGPNDMISINAIAEELHVEPGELSEHINTLSDLYYIRFVNLTNEKIRLTNTGRYTIVPGYSSV